MCAGKYCIGKYCAVCALYEMCAIYAGLFEHMPAIQLMVFQRHLVVLFVSFVYFLPFMPTHVLFGRIVLFVVCTICGICIGTFCSCVGMFLHTNLHRSVFFLVADLCRRSYVGLYRDVPFCGCE